MDLDRFRRALATTRADGCGIARWSVFASEIRRITLGTQDRETGSPHAPLTITDGLTARYRLVWDDGKVSRGAIERRALESEPEAALAAARAAAYLDPDATDVLGPAAFPEVATHDPDAAAIAGGAVEPFAPRLAAIRERVLRRDLRTWSGSMHAAVGFSRVLTSEGLDVSGAGTSAGWSASMDGEFGMGHAARRLEGFADFEARLDRLVDFVLALRAPAPARGAGVVPVLWHPDVVDDYVLTALLHNLEGAQVAHGTGAFRRSQFGTGAPVLREDLVLRNDPLLPMAAGSYRYTQEGLPSRACTYIDRGRLVTPVLDLKYARRLGLAPTPAPAAADTVFLEGPRAIPYDAALARAAGGALVLNVLGIHTQDLTSGDFSLSAPQTLAIGPGGIDGRLRGTISGNLFELLRSDALELVGFPGEHVPGLLVSCRLDPA